MGIRGLTTFIAQNNDRSFVPYRLHDCHLVIDGNSIASQLYVREYGRCKSNQCAFGGDYDEYGRTVKRFFTLLACCSVKSIVVFDGGKEPRKLITGLARLKNCISITGSITPSNSRECPLPLLMLEVFKWVAARSGATIAMCDFEADEEIAALARTLSCPLLSFDSDFYIHAVPFYIPFPTLPTELTEELVKPSNENSSAVSVQRYLECSAFSVSRFLSRRDVGEWRKKSGGSKEILQVEVLPLIAALLGNDYVKPQTFRHFLSQIQIPKSHSRNYRQRRIVGLLEWLRLQGSLDSAIKKILSHTKKGQREQLEKIIRDTVEVYVGCSSKLVNHLSAKLPSQTHADDGESEGFRESQRDTLITYALKERNDKNEVESVSDTRKTKCEEDGALVNPVPATARRESEDSSCSSSDGGSDSCKSDSEEDSESDSIVAEQNGDWDQRRDNLPPWFLERFRRCELPSSFMDILMRRTYLCPPQVEDQSQPHSHAISFPILSAIVRLLTPSTESPLKCMTRVNRHAASLNLDPFPQQSSWPIPENILSIPVCDRIHIIFQSLNLIDDCDEKNRTRKLSLESLPLDWRLLALSLAYWKRACSQQNSDERFLIAACFCVVVLRVVDQRAGPPGKKSRKVRNDTKREGSTQNSQVKTGKPILSENQRQKVIGDSKIDETIPHIEQQPFVPTAAGNLKEPKVNQKSVKELLQLVSTAECLKVSGLDGMVYQMRQVDGYTERVGFFNDQYHRRKRPRAFNVTTVHGFSELQSVILHVSYLNSLLGHPFAQNAPQTSFSGTMAYNAYYETHGKLYNSQSGKSIWECLLGTSVPSLENLMDEFFKSVMKLACGMDECEKSLVERKQKKKKRRKKSDVSVQREKIDAVEATGNDDINLLDPENKFSILGLVE